jgi:hypothetical protein
VYIAIATYAGQTDSCRSRRLKSPLHGIPPKSIAAAAYPKAESRGLGRMEDPVVRQSRDFEGWKARSAIEAGSVTQIPRSTANEPRSPKGRI